MNRGLHRIYTSVEHWKRWLDRRFTPLGRHVLLIACLALFFGINVQRTMIYQLFSAAFIVLAFSYFLSLRFAPQVAIRRSLPATCVAGQRLTYRLRVENRGEKPLAGIHFREAVCNSMPSAEEFIGAREDGEENRNLFDRKMGYYRWQWLLAMARRIVPEEQALPEIPAGGQKEVEASLLPLRRGAVHLDGVSLARMDPFGICRRRRLFGDACNLLVLPRIYNVPKLFFEGSRKYHQGGITAARDLGDSSEFLSLREYVQGDPIKNIDWKATARTRRTIVKQYRSEYFSRYGLVLDSFTASRYSQEFEEAVSLAASVMLSQDSLNSVLDLLFVERECVTCTVGSGLSGHQRMLEILASVSTCTDRKFDELAGLVRSHADLLSGVVVILIDFDGQRKKLVEYLLTNAISTRVILITKSREEFEQRHGEQARGLPLRVLEVAKVEEQVGSL